MRRIPSLALTALLGCSGQPPSPRPQTPVSKPPASTDGGPAPAVRNAAFEAQLAEWARLNDFRNTFFQREQPAAKPLRIRAPFATAGIASARAFTYGIALDCASTRGLPVDQAGRMCEGAYAPGAELSAEQLGRALAVVDAAFGRVRTLRAEAKARGSTYHSPVSRCEFDPHHALLFYDASGAVIGGLLVCFSCALWVSVPSHPGLEQMMSKEEVLAMDELFGGFGLGSRFFGDASRDLWEYERRVYGTPYSGLTDAGNRRREDRVALHSGVDPLTPVRTLTRAQRLRSCTWFHQELSLGKLAHPGSGFECLSGQVYSLREQSTSECADVKPRCDTTVGQMEACLGVVLVDPGALCVPGPPAPCNGVIDCLPELEWGKPRAAVTTPASDGSRPR
jgi:hypothetical protein